MQPKLKTVRAWSLAAAALLFVTGGAMADDLWVSVGPSGDALVGPSTSAAVPVVTVTESETAGFRARVEVTGFGATPKQTSVGEFLDLHWPDASIAGEIGAPGLPVVRRLFVAPPEATVSVRVDAGAALVIDLEAEGLPWRVLSVQPPIEKVPGAIERAVFQYDEAAYRTAPIATELATVEEVGIVRGQRLLLLEVRPIEYDPVARTLTYRPELEVGVQFHGGRAPDSAVSPLRGLYRIVLNPELLHGPTGGGRGSGNYLIIVASVYETDIAAFGTAKGAQGFTVTTHAVAAGTTNSAIKTYIQGLWGGADAPDYILLVGDTDTIPHWTGGGAGSPSTDLPYTCMDGATDWHPDIAIGRFPVRSSSQLQAIVDKTLYYENGPLSDPDYLKRAVFMASEDNYTVSEGTHNWVIDNYMDPNDIVSDKLYCHTYNATTQQVRDSFNDGRFFGIYSGHGGTYSWADGPPFSQSDVNNLTNADMYAFVMSFACVTGTYTVNECFTETWIRAPNKGALTIYGSSVNSYWTEDDVLEKRHFDSIYDYEDNVLSEVGPVWVDTLLRYEAQMGSGSTTRRYFEMYNLMGDPSLCFPGACSDAGTIALDQTRYACAGEVGIRVVDCGLNTDDNVIETVTITIESPTEPTGESVVLAETGADTADFRGSIELSIIDAPGVLQISEFDTVTATYIDADDGQGGTNVVVRAQGKVDLDCQSPVISDVQVAEVGVDTATVTFVTDEPAIGTVRYGSACGALTESVAEADLDTSHVLALTGLTEASEYFFAVDAADEYGNASTDDNGGVCYSFITHGDGDFDGDADVDLGDFAGFQVCFGELAGLSCAPGNMTGVDAMIDLDDFAAFVAVLNSPQ